MMNGFSLRSGHIDDFRRYEWLNDFILDRWFEIVEIKCRSSSLPIHVVPVYWFTLYRVTNYNLLLIKCLQAIFPLKKPASL